MFAAVPINDDFCPEITKSEREAVIRLSVDEKLY